MIRSGVTVPRRPWWPTNTSTYGGDDSAVKTFLASGSGRLTTSASHPFGKKHIARPIPTCFVVNAASGDVSRLIAFENRIWKND